MRKAKTILYQIFKELLYIEVEVLCMVYGLCGYRIHTVPEIAGQLGMECKEVRDTQRNAIKKIQKKVQEDEVLSDGLKDVLELLSQERMTEDGFEAIAMDTVGVRWLHQLKTNECFAVPIPKKPNPDKIKYKEESDVSEDTDQNSFLW